MLYDLAQLGLSSVSQLALLVIERFKPEICYSVFRFVALYGSQCWRLAVMESSVRCHDHFRNEDIRDPYGVARIVEKLREKLF